MISGQFFGHTHSDSFELYYHDANLSIPASAAFISPSLTTFGKSNPSFRILEVFKKSLKINTIKTYVTDIEEANRLGKPRWILEYDFKQDFQLADLEATSLHTFVDRLERDEILFQKYWIYHKKMALNGETCDKSCKEAFLCRLRSSSHRLACPTKNNAHLDDSLFVSNSC